MSDDAPLLSRVFAVDTAREAPQAVTILTDDRQRAAIAKANGLPDVAMLKSDLEVGREAPGLYRVTGTVHARLTQICVVSLDPFESTMAEPVDVRFAEPARGAPRDGIEDEESTEDPPDPILDGHIDLGALTTEFFALGLDPYPRKPGAAFAEPQPAGDSEKPFAGLAALRPKDDTPPRTS